MASQSIAEFPALAAGQVADDDLLPIVDVSDLSSPGGTTKKVTSADYLYGIIPRGNRTVTTERAYQDHNAVFDIESYGALADNSTDARVAIQLAIADAALVNGTVVIGDGTYAVSASGNTVPGASGLYALLVPSGVTIRGKSPKSTLRCTTDAATIIAVAGASSASHATDVTFQGFSLIGGDTTNNGLGRGILLFRADRCRLEDLDLSGMRLGIQCDRLSADAAYNTGLTLSNVRVRNTFGTTTGNGTGIFISGCDGVAMDAIQCLNVAEHGLYISQDSKNISLSGATLQPATSANGNCGVQIYTAVTVPNITNLTFSAVTITGGKWGFLASAAGGGKIDRVSWAGGSVENCLTNGIILSNAQNSTLSAITVTNTTAGSGIELDGCRSIVVAGCISTTNANYGLITVTSPDCQVIGGYYLNNDQSNTTCYGIRLGGNSTGCRVLMATCTDYQVSKTQKYGISLDAGSTGCEIAYCTTTGNVTGEILDGVSASTLSTRTLILSRTLASAQEVLAPAGQDLFIGVPLKALGGGAAPTFGTIGATGPSTAAQNSWLRLVDSTGASFFVPTWK